MERTHISEWLNYHVPKTISINQFQKQRPGTCHFAWNTIYRLNCVAGGKTNQHWASGSISLHVTALMYQYNTISSTPSLLLIIPFLHKSSLNIFPFMHFWVPLPVYCSFIHIELVVSCSTIFCSHSHQRPLRSVTQWILDPLFSYTRARVSECVCAPACARVCVCLSAWMSERV